MVPTDGLSWRVTLAPVATRAAGAAAGAAATLGADLRARGDPAAGLTAFFDILAVGLVLDERKLGTGPVEAIRTGRRRVEGRSDGVWRHVEGEERRWASIEEGGDRRWRWRVGRA